MTDALTASIHIVAVRPDHRPALGELIASLDTFDQEERDVALELIDESIARPEATGYHTLVAELDGQVVGYVCYGPTPMTRGTYDLYWIATSPQHQRRGIAQKLGVALHETLARTGARLVRVETSSRTDYGAAQSLYPRLGYAEAARIVGFYDVGDDLVTFIRTLTAE